MVGAPLIFFLCYIFNLYIFKYFSKIIILFLNSDRNFAESAKSWFQLNFEVWYGNDLLTIVTVYKFDSHWGSHNCDLIAK